MWVQNSSKPRAWRRFQERSCRLKRKSPIVGEPQSRSPMASVTSRSRHFGEIELHDDHARHERVSEADAVRVEVVGVPAQAAVHPLDQVGMPGQRGRGEGVAPAAQRFDGQLGLSGCGSEVP